MLNNFTTFLSYVNGNPANYFSYLYSSYNKILDKCEISFILGAIIAIYSGVYNVDNYFIIYYIFSSLSSSS